MLLMDVISQVITFLIMAGGVILLLDLAREAPSSVKRAGLHQHEAIFLAVGGFAGLLFNIPVILVNDSLLAINIGGVLVPVFISFYLLSRRFGYACLIFSISVICAFTLLFTYDVTYSISLAGSYPVFSLAFILIVVPVSLLVLFFRYEKKVCIALSLFITIFAFTAYTVFYTTSFDPSIGITSDLPYFLIPLFLPGLLALVFFHRDIGIASAIAYPGASFGVLVGADLVRIPILVTRHNIIGAIGGAGGLDLIYLSGVISISIVILYSHFQREKKSVGLSRYRYHLQMSKEKMRRAIYAVRSGKYDDAIHLAIGSVEERVLAYRSLLKIEGEIHMCIYAMNISDPLKYDYWLMHTLRDKKDKESAVRAIITASVLNRAILREESTRKRVASIPERVLALIIDTMIILSIVIPLGIYVLSRYEYSFLTMLMDIQSPVPTAYILLATSFFIVYNFVFEGLWGQTPGKWLTGLKVIRDDGEDVSIIDSLIRNVIRAVDFLPLGYAVGGLSMYYTPSRQRLGDILARTIVVRIQAPS